MDKPIALGEILQICLKLMLSVVDYERTTNLHAVECNYSKRQYFYSNLFHFGRTFIPILLNLTPIKISVFVVVK